MKLRRRSATACGFVMGAIAQAATAQTVPTPPGGVTLEPVTITANKREERLQEVPATATVVQPQQLEQQNILTIEDLTRAVPTFDASEAGGLTLRGFGGLSYALTAESSVGILVDGVSLSGAGLFPPNLFDLERVEVLEGPQGTLFGKNSSAGVINIVTRAPNTRKFEGLARLGLQNRDGKSAQAAINVPLSDKLAFRLSGSVLDDPRSTHNLVDGAWDSPHKTNARLRVLWKVTNDLTVNLGADQSITTLRGGGRWTIYQSTPGSLLTRTLNACGVTVGPENTDVCLNPGQNGSRSRAQGYSAKIDWVVGDYILTSVSAVREAKNDVPGGDYDSVNLPVPAYTQVEAKRFHNVSQEFRVASRDFDWGNFVAGAYYFKGDTSQDITSALRLPAFRVGQRNLINGDITSSALFGQGTYKVNKALSMNFGARLGREQVSATRTGTLAPGAVAAISAPTLIPVAGDTTDTYASWRAGAQYDFNPDRIAYLTYTHGYESLEQRVQERTRELQETQAQLVTTARRAGMAEIANNVLHNVGNVLNSINVSASVLRDTIGNSKVDGLTRAVNLINEHEHDLPRFIESDPRGKALRPYLNELARALRAERQDALSDLERLSRSIDHIIYVVSTQQAHAGPSSVLEMARPRELVDEALHLSAALIERHGVAVTRRGEDLPVTAIDKQRVVQILVNLIGNAAKAMEGADADKRQLTVSTDLVRGEGGRRLRITVQDQGEGIAPDHLARIFAHGFTTREDGHGFGLHSCALAAVEMGGRLTTQSDGPGLGATFTLELPFGR